jgi:hypothetical protein
MDAGTGQVHDGSVIPALPDFSPRMEGTAKCTETSREDAKEI